MAIDSKLMCNCVLCVGKASQVQHVPQIVPDAGRFEIAHVRPQRQLAFPLSRLSKRIQQADQSAQSPLFTHG